MNVPIRGLFRLSSLITLFLAGITASAGQALQCNSSAAFPIIRAEGLAEYVSDYILACTGGTPTSAGQSVPQVTITFTLKAGPSGTTNVTSNPTGIFNEALLIVDEPSSALNPNRPTLNCGAPGAPDNGSGPGTCAILSTGDPAATYDGTPNGYGAGAVCDGVGHPAANTYQCGRPNVFQGRTDAGSNIIQFVGVPFDPPGPGVFRYVRLSNVRVDASNVRPTSVVVFPTVLGKVEITGMSVTIPNPEIQLAGILPGMYNPIESVFASPILFREGTPGTWRARNLSATVGDNSGTLGNGTFNGSYWAYNGSSRNPADISQNVPGAVYNTESGFLWPNNGANRPPVPNPPDGYGYLPNGLPLLGGPLASAAFGGVDTGISAAGLAQAGTRFAIRFTNIPPGGSVTLPTTLQITRQQEATATGVLGLTSTDSAGAGPYSPRGGTFTATDDLAVYEVLYSDSNIVEDANIPFTLAGFPDGVQLRGITSFAPFYSQTAAHSASAPLPEPRFVDPCRELPCLSVFPGSARSGDTVNVDISAHLSLSIGAATLMLDGAQVKLVGEGPPDIVATSAVLAGRTLTASFNLAGAPPGIRDVVLTLPTGAVNAVPGGFTVGASMPCTYTVGPLAANFTLNGGSGFVTVAPLPSDCVWFASSPNPWILLEPRQGQVQPYSVATNTGGANRRGTITIAGQTVTVTQAGTYSSATQATAVFRAGNSSIGLTSQPSGIASTAGGVFASAPGSAVDIDGKTVVAARDWYNAIWANSFDPTTQSWSGWQFGGGVVAGNPSVATAPDGTTWIAARDQYNSYWLVSFTPSGGFGTWTPLYGVFATDPAVAACPDGNIYVVGKDNSNALWGGQFVPDSGVVHFILGGGVVQGEPSVTCGNDSAVYVAVRDNSNSNWIARMWKDVWTGWYNGGAVSSIDPKIANSGGSLRIVTLDSGGAAWRSGFAPGITNGWQLWTGVGGVLEDIAPAVVNGELFFTGRSPDQALWWWRQSGNQWTGAGSYPALGPLSMTPR